MSRGQLHGAADAGAAVFVVLVGLGGCGGPLGDEVPVASAASPAAAVERPASARLPSLVSADGSLSSGPGASDPEASASADESASALVLLVDEPPFFRGSRARVSETSAKEQGRPSRQGHPHRPYHPAPGIIVDVVDAQGGASAAGLQRAARNVGYWPFRRCYEEGLRRNQRLTGKVPLQLLVDPSGAVERTEVTAATLADPSVATCVAREALHLSLVASESSTDTKMVVTLARGDEPVPVPLPVPGASELREALRALWPSVARCYVSELSRYPDVGGRMELRFRVSPSGEVVDVAEGDTRFGDEDVTHCVVDVYRTTQLPPPRRAPRDAVFIYAMHLEPRSDTLPVQQGAQ